ncbi:MAG: S-methyl-5-thioribose-1-phosphate isomerase [Planctomycetes bacterium]|nr:S-methyl-5-thioribose-1-phosphate isomerase [Planctomycetota bacterium]
MPVPTIDWVGGLPGKIKMIDQTLLPNQYKFLYCDNVKCAWDAIKRLVVRGAPAIGVAAAMGTVVGIQKSKAKTMKQFRKDLKKVTSYLATSRPTAVNLFWALDRMERVADENSDKTVPELKRILLDEAKTILEEDKKICRRIGRNGAKLVKKGDTILTHCNAGGLATGDYGTALAVMFAAHEAGKKISVYADETRPLLQGARLTTWELMKAKIPVTLICDNMAAQVMKEGRIDLVVVGADRIAGNGDAANKIGTYGVAILAKEHGVPFYVAAPASTFDLTLKTGEEIPIEERAAEEVTEGFGKRTAPKGAKVYSPAFDVTPAKYIAGIITERGVIRKPTSAKVRKMIA